MDFSSYLVADFVLSEANNQFAPLFKPSEERLEVFKQYCSVIDKLVGDFGGTTLEVEVDDEDMSVHMKLELEELVVDDHERAMFTQLLERTVSFRVEHGEGDTILLHFVFPSLWEKAV